jgi:hypothetical protein
MNRQKDLCRLDSNTIQWPLSMVAGGWIQHMCQGGDSLALFTPLAALAFPETRSDMALNAPHRACEPGRPSPVDRSRAAEYSPRRS